MAVHKGGNVRQQARGRPQGNHEEQEREDAAHGGCLHMMGTMFSGMAGMGLPAMRGSWKSVSPCESGYSILLICLPSSQAKRLAKAILARSSSDSWE